MMELSRETVAGVIGAVIAVLLQITVAPAITLFEAVPNFIVAFCVVRAVATPAASGSVMPLVLGLLFDLMGGDSWERMAFIVLVLVAFLASRLFMALNNDTLFMPVAIMLACIMLVEGCTGSSSVCGADIALLGRPSSIARCPACSTTASSAFCCIRSPRG